MFSHRHLRINIYMNVCFSRSDDNYFSLYFKRKINMMIPTIEKYFGMKHQDIMYIG